MDDAPIPDFDRVQVSLDTYDPDSVRARVLAMLREQIPDGRSARRAPHELGPRLHALLGDWYTAGPTVGDETVSGWCWCHSFWKPIQSAGVPDDMNARIEVLADGLMEQVEVCRRWRLELARWIWDRDPSRFDAHLEHELVELVGHLVDLGVHECWYQHFDTAVVWMLQGHGRPVTPKLAEQVGLAAEMHFSSWVEPSDAARRRFAESTAWAAYELWFDRAYPEP